MDGGSLDEDLAYWKTQLQGAPLSINLPSDFLPSAVASFAARSSQWSCHRNSMKHCAALAGRRRYAFHALA